MTIYSADCRNTDYPTENGNIVVRTVMELPRYINKTEILDNPQIWVTIFNSNPTGNLTAKLMDGTITITMFAGTDGDERVTEVKKLILNQIASTNKKYLEDIEEEKNLNCKKQEQIQKDRKIEQQLRKQHGNTL